MDSSTGLKQYFSQTFQEKLLRDVAGEKQHVTPATAMLETRREMADVDQALDAQKDDFQLKMENLAQRRAELERKELELQESLLKFDRFLKENDARRVRADNKTRDELELTMAKERQVEQLARELDQLRAKRDRNRKIIAQNETFERYLKGVLSESSDYAHIDEVIKRHGTLTATNVDLKEREQNTSRKMDEVSAQLATTLEESRVEKLYLNNKRRTLLKELEKLQGDAVDLETQHRQVQSNASKRTLLVGRVRMAIANLYDLVRERSKTAAGQGDSTDPVSQLDVIEKFIEDLKDITREFERGHIYGAEASP